MPIEHELRVGEDGGRAVVAVDVVRVDAERVLDRLAPEPSCGRREGAERRAEHVARGEVAGLRGPQARVHGDALGAAVDAGGIAGAATPRPTRGRRRAGSRRRRARASAPRAARPGAARRPGASSRARSARPSTARSPRRRAARRASRRPRARRRGSRRSVTSTIVTREPSRPSAWPSSSPIGPAPITSRRSGSSRRRSTSSLVRYGRVGQAGDRQPRRRRPRRDDDPPRPQALAVHGHDAGLLEARLAHDDPHPGQRLEVRPRPVRPAVHDRLDAADHRAHVHLDPAGPHAVLGRGPRPRARPRRCGSAPCSGCSRGSGRSRRPGRAR